MQKQKGLPAQAGISTLVGVIIIVAVAVVLFGGVFAYQYFAKSQTPVTNDQQNPNVQNQQQNQTINQQTDNSTQPTITVISPNGGEVLKINDKYKITWESNGLSNKKVNITVMGSDQNNKGLGGQYIAFSVPISQGYYYWTPNTEIPSFLSDTNKYKIIIGLNDNLSSGNPISDESNSYFNIDSGAVEINAWPDVNSFNLSNKTFTAKDLNVIANVKIVTNNATKIYRQDNGNEYHDFQWLYSTMKNWVGPNWKFTIKGFMQPDGSILAYEIFYKVQ